MKIQTIAIAAALLLQLTAFAQKTETRDVSGFTSVGLSGGFSKVTFKQGSKEGVVIKTNKIDPDKITTELDGNNLRIGMKKGSYYNTGEIDIEVTYNKLEAIANSGSSDIEILGTLKASKFEFASSGSGDLKGDFDVEDFEIAISGSSDMTLSGQANEQHYAISGSGDVDASKLRGKSAEVAISGSGDVDLNVEGNVKTRISGSGDVNNRKN
jgi:hypothetical protein